MADAVRPKKSRRRVPPGLLRRADAAEFCGAGTSTWDRWTAAGLTPEPVKVGGAVLWSCSELAAWCRHRCPPRAEWQPVWAALGRPAQGPRQRRNEVT